MSKVQLLRALVEQRISLAAEEIFGLFERTIAEYEEELCRSKEENQRNQKLLEALWNPEVLVHTEDEPVSMEDWDQPRGVDLIENAQLLLVAQDQSPSLDLESDLEPTHIKEEQEAEVTRATPTPVPVKSEDDEEEVHHRLEPHGPNGSSDPDLNQVYMQDLNCRPEPNGPGSTKAVSPVVRRQVGQKSTVHRCPECGQTFGLKSSLKAHMKVHGKEKPFCCPDCGKGFAVKTSLFAHVKVHSGERPFSCSVCKKHFKWPSHVRMHMVTHTGEKLFHCSVCGRRFSQKSALHSHMRIHTGEKPFHCSVCNKRFAQQGNVSKHMVTHTGERKFDCSLCGTGFTSKSNLLRHVLTSHIGEKPFSCSVCTKRFTLKGYLQKHMKTHTKQGNGHG